MATLRVSLLVSLIVALVLVSFKCEVRPDQLARTCRLPLTRDVGLQGRRSLAYCVS